jgi:hypothetical protein
LTGFSRVGFSRGGFQAKVCAVASMFACVVSMQAQPRKTVPDTCRRVIFEGDVHAGDSFDKAFTTNLRFYLEPLRSGWIVRVLDRSGVRGRHDYAELSTPPYRSVSPLLISTDWSFRAQDAIAWNPRRFRYAASKGELNQLAGLYAGVMANDGKASTAAARLIASQPEGVLRILDARIAPGMANQAQMAAVVASHLAETPYTVDRSGGAAALGKIEELRFRVEFDLSPSEMPAKGVSVQKIHCAVPTT